MGLLLGIEITSVAAPIIARARANGLLIINAGENVLRVAPALIAGKAEIDEAVTIIGRSIAG